MKYLLLMRGLPGSGKSTFIEENNLSNYVVCPDSLRVLFGGLVQGSEGHMTIPQSNEKSVWGLVNKVMDERMSRGEFVVLDATNLDSSKFENYRKLKDLYRYRVFVIDFSDISLSECLERNRYREEHKQVPEYVIRRMDLQLSTQQFPGWIEVVKPEDFSDRLNYYPIDFSGWSKIHHIGDIHGCHSVLKDYLNGRLKEDELYIFCGDFFERGIENVEVMNFLLQIYTRKNVIMLEGNHEKYLYQWACDLLISSKTFKSTVKVEFEDYGISKKDVRKFYRKLRQIVYYEYGSKRVLVSHGGISNMTNNLLYLPTEQFIKGVGGYDTDIDSKFTENILKYETSINDSFEYYQVHGHRNEFELGVCNGRSFNLEGRVERGGHLRVVTLTDTAFETFEIKNECYDPKYKDYIINDELSIEDYITVLRNNRYINERDNGHGVSSFNFNQKVFYDKIWNSQTVKARGLHIDILNNEIIARSYDKFFNINEMESTLLENLEINLTYPVRSYIKENGFLGLIGLHKGRNEFYISSKGDSLGEYAGMVKELFVSQVNNKDRLKEYLLTEDVTLVFEVINCKKDPHIIKYERDELILLDIVYNTIEFKKKPYEELLIVSDLLGIGCKELGPDFNSYSELKLFYENEMKEDPINGSPSSIEGYIIEDCEGSIVKIKNPYYNYWKRMRGLLHRYLSGGALGSIDGFEKDFIEYYKNLNSINKDIDIIKLREDFFKNKEEI